MDVFLSHLDIEDSANRVLEWLKHCSATPRDIEHCGDVPKDKGNVPEKSISILQRKSSDEESGQFISRQGKNASREHLSKSNQSRTRSKRSRSSETDSGCITLSTNNRNYSYNENQQMIKYIIDHDAFPFLKGTLLWQKMEKEKVCYRSWQSMKSQFIIKIYPKLDAYSLEDENKHKIIEHMKPSEQKKFIHMEPGKRGWRKNGRYYTVEEDITILKYIYSKRRHLKVHGNAMWQTMEDRQILPERSWQSMRSRYLNTIRHSLDKYELKKHGIEISVNSMKNDLSDKKKQHIWEHEVPPPLSPCTNTVAEKKRNQLRKHSISTSVQLASRLNFLRNTSQNVRNSERNAKDISSVSLSHQVTPDSEAIGFAKHNPSKKKSNNSVRENNTKDAIVCAVPIPVSNLGECAVTSFAVSVESDKTVIIGENSAFNGDSGKSNVVNRNNIENATSSVMQSAVPDLRETVVATSGSLNKSCHDVITATDVEKHTTTSEHNSIAEEKKISSKESDNEGSILQLSVCSKETIKFEAVKCFNSHNAVGDCKKCSNEHELSPSSN